MSAWVWQLSSCLKMEGVYYASYVSGNASFTGIWESSPFTSFVNDLSTLLLLAWTLLCLPKGFSRTLFCLRTTGRRWMKLNNSPGIYFKSFRQHFVATGTCLIVPEGDKEGSWSKLDVHLVSCNVHWKVETWETSQIVFRGNLQDMWQHLVQLWDLCVPQKLLTLTDLCAFGSYFVTTSNVILQFILF